MSHLSEAVELTKLFPACGGLTQVHFVIWMSLTNTNVRWPFSNKLETFVFFFERGQSLTRHLLDHQTFCIFHDLFVVAANRTTCNLSRSSAWCPSHRPCAPFKCRRRPHRGNGGRRPRRRVAFDLRSRNKCTPPSGWPITASTLDRWLLEAGR